MVISREKNAMKKVYFCDTGVRNFIARNFNAVEMRPDSGALFENYAMLELWRNKGPGGELRFYRTSDGAEVDFVLDTMNGKAAVECKFRKFNKPINFIALRNFCDEESIASRYVLNRNANMDNKGLTYLPGFLADRIRT
jgi:predicted AAA+ superfamily ATPase